MKYTLDQKQKAYRNLPDEVKDFVMSNESTNIAEKALILAGLNDEQIDEADSEIFYAMIGLQSFEDSMMNISKLTGKTASELSSLRENLQNEIFEVIKYLHKPEKSALEKTISEIGAKYSLNDEQRGELIKIVEDVYQDHEKRELILSGLENRLDISGILSEQILIELEERVFNAKLTSKVDNSFEISKKVESMPKVEEYEGATEFARFSQNSQNPVLDSQKSNEVEVPKYGSGAINTQKSSSASIIEKKLGGVTSSNSTPLKYEKDPYREPLN